MKEHSHKGYWLRISLLSLGMPGLLSGMAIAQTQPDVVIEGEPEATTTDGSPRFVCELDQGRYTVMYLPESQPGTMYPWAVPQSMGGGWTAEKRCMEISRRLESYREDGLKELTTNMENNYDVVCVTTEENNSCQIVFTVPPGQNAIATRDSVFENLASADDGMQTQGVNTFMGNDNNGNILGQLQNILGGNLNMGMGQSMSTSNGINLKPFLDPRDGGTGSQLRQRSNNRPAAPSRELNPNLFR